MNYLDENRPEGKMSLSNGECEDIDTAFEKDDWTTIIKYVAKYYHHWKPSEEQMKALWDAYKGGKEQEQPEVDLEKFTDKIKTFQERYKYPEVVSIKGAMAFMARMFYQYPNAARQWYDRLPKTIMN